MLSWLKRFNIFCFLDSCGYQHAPHRYDLLVGAGVVAESNPAQPHTLDALAATPRWKFGYLSYPFKNTLHHFQQKHYDPVGFNDYFFFIPEVVLLLKGGLLTIEAADPDGVYRQICDAVPEATLPAAPIQLQPRVSRQQYIETIGKLQQHIVRGDCYEINYCMEFFHESAVIDPYAVYSRLTEVSPNPFSAFCRHGHRYLLSASPERFLYRQAQGLVSQPIKGTISRNLSNTAADVQCRQQLQNSRKDQSENVMVVDLVRNDLSRICVDGSVKVDELFGIYSFPQVYQMISTISGTLRPDVGFLEILKACFPMGSMTGAPKHRVMQLIDAYESSSRGIFSGSVGYISPEGDFDFNVVIRSLMYEALHHYLSYQVGSGITFYSEAEKEWEECMLKAAAIRKVLEGHE